MIGERKEYLFFFLIGCRSDGGSFEEKPRESSWLKRKNSRLAYYRIVSRCRSYTRTRRKRLLRTLRVYILIVGSARSSLIVSLIVTIRSDSSRLVRYHPSRYPCSLKIRFESPRTLSILIKVGIILGELKFRCYKRVRVILIISPFSCSLV